MARREAVDGGLPVGFDEDIRTKAGRRMADANAVPEAKIEED
ncbi:MAG TPA: hypothetical protein PKK84_05325 [Armatimonadota bacterium]|nr:hypothetical protein [Armatimonadota bacterium]